MHLGIKLGAAGHAAITLPHVIVFHLWVYSSVYSALDADMAEHILQGSLDRVLSATNGEARPAAMKSRVLSQFSFEMLFSFLEETAEM